MNVAVLTASTPVNANDRQPSEEPSFWPTQDNVISHLKNIIKEARCGDYVYNHYSGHGTRIRCADEKEQGLKLKLALVLYEKNAPHRSYFRGSQLAKAMQKMGNKGLLVPLVLDCCFSGSTTRNGGSKNTWIRATEYEFEDNIPHEDAFATSLELEGGAYQNSRIAPKWLVDPEGYMVLSACGPVCSS